jgi:REP element-mobilizing transposase RayT
MARPLRIEYEGAFYHVTARGNERRDIYFGKTDYEKFKAYLKEAQEKYGYILHCYVLMTNHYHLLIETPMPNLKEVMHYVNGAYTNYVNIKRGSSWKRVGKKMSWKRYNMALDKGKRSFIWARKPV